MFDFAVQLHDVGERFKDAQELPDLGQILLCSSALLHSSLDDLVPASQVSTGQERTA